MKEKAKQLVMQMTLQEKAALCSGNDFWTLKPLERLGLPRVMVTDGPHGLRKQAGDSSSPGINNNVPSTCFPPSCALTASFNRDLVNEIGQALGEECLQEDVAVILGPGVNIKRSPLCGRNFEYFSEDPYLAGELSANHIAGVQSKGVGTSLKHFAVNNQETCRLTVDAAVDERALREIYLTAFETAVKRSRPWTVMCAYNKVNGTYASEHKRLLTDILRDEWGFEGLVMSDWGACNDRPGGIRAGLDLEMPGRDAYNDTEIIKAVQEGRLSESELDAVVTRNVELVLNYMQNRRQGYTYSVDKHHALARRAAAQSSVLLKNEDGVLPLKGGAAIAVIGAFAQNPRYQGSGSSNINPTKTDNPAEELEKAGLTVQYAQGYDPISGDTDDTLVAAACEAAKGKDAVILFAGLPDSYESEGFDRTTLDMPAGHNRLIEAVAKVNANTVVVLMCGAPVLMPWSSQVKGILLAYLGGQAVGGALADLLTGRVSPSGKLAETFPLALADTPCARYFPGEPKAVQYRESIFVGYRYYDAAGCEVAYPFGYGLSYTTFAYSDLKLSSDTFAQGDKLTAEVTVTNTGMCDGAEVIQLYIGRPQAAIFRAPKELRGFEKIFLKAGERKTIRFTLTQRSFAYYNVAAEDWSLEGGTYSVMVGASSRDIRLTQELSVTGDGREVLLTERYRALPGYYNPAKGGFSASDEEFVALYGAPLPAGTLRSNEPITMNTTVGELAETEGGKELFNRLEKEFIKTFEGQEIDLMTKANFYAFPLRSIGMMTGERTGRAEIGQILQQINRQRK